MSQAIFIVHLHCHGRSRDATHEPTAIAARSDPPSPAADPMSLPDHVLKLSPRIKLRAGSSNCSMPALEHAEARQKRARVRIRA